MAKESFELGLLLVSKAPSPQAEMKWLVTQKSRRSLQTWGYVQMGPSWQPDPRGKSSERVVISPLGHLHENFSSQGFHFAKWALWKQCLKQAQHSLLTSTTCLAPSQHQQPSLLLLEFGSENTNPSFRPSEHFVSHSVSLAWVQCADDVFSGGRG